MRPLPAFSRYAARDPHKPIASMLKGTSRAGIGEVASVELHTGLKAGTTEFRTLGLAEQGPRVVVFHARSRFPVPRGFWPFAGKSDIRPAARSAESRDFVGA
jgi:hypothetical protein